jgi:hypothetical protein
MCDDSKLELRFDYRRTPYFQSPRRTPFASVWNQDTRFGRDGMSRCSLSRCRLYPAHLRPLFSQPLTTTSDQPQPTPALLDKSQPTSSPTVPAIRILRRVFSVSNLTCGKPVTYPIRTLRELYHGAHARGTLNDLSGSQFSAIIFLFGTLSVHDPPSQFMSPLAQLIDKRRYRAWWGFIFQLVRDKKRVKGLLNEGDLYWLLRAKTSEASLTGLDVYAGDSGGLTIHHNRTILINA